jgi:hypothetical protein
MVKKGKYLLMLILAGVLYASGVQSQTLLTPANTIVVTAKAGTAEAKAAVEAVEKTDFSNYRLRSLHRKLTFENGVVIELLSAEEMVNLGYKLNPMYFREKMEANYSEPLYSVAPNGILIQIFQAAPSSSKSKIN